MLARPSTKVALLAYLYHRMCGGGMTPERAEEVWNQVQGGFPDGGSCVRVCNLCPSACLVLHLYSFSPKEFAGYDALCTGLESLTEIETTIGRLLKARILADTEAFRTHSRAFDQLSNSAAG